MTFWTAHLAAGRQPILLREGFAWGAFLFGPFWLLLHRAWIAAVLSFVTWFVVLRLSHDALGVLLPALMFLHGLSGNDLRAWTLERRGYLLAHVVAGRTETDALASLLNNRPDLMTRMAEP